LAANSDKPAVVEYILIRVSIICLRFVKASFKPFSRSLDIVTEIRVVSSWNPVNFQFSSG
jgi:hypothetical protein